MAKHKLNRTETTPTKEGKLNQAGNTVAFKIEHYMDVSTVHITAQDDALLKQQCEKPTLGMVVYAYDYGFFVYLVCCPAESSSKPAQELSKTLKERGFSDAFASLVGLVVQAGHDKIRLDRDGTVYEGLPEFDW